MLVGVFSRCASPKGGMGPIARDREVPISQTSRQQERCGVAGREGVDQFSLLLDNDYVSCLSLPGRWKTSCHWEPPSKLPPLVSTLISRIV